MELQGFNPQAFEKMGVFYLGRQMEMGGEEQMIREELPLLYDSKDLTTHAMCVGMTGSGKTGLCIGLLEEAALDGIPALIIDPKGDLANLFLTFPELRGEDFAPWVDPDAARLTGMDRAGFGAAEAGRWREGLAEWGQDGDRIRRMKERVSYRLCTPGSTSGEPISIVHVFDRPAQAIMDDPEFLAAAIETAVNSLLGLAGEEAGDGYRKAGALLSAILQKAWQAGTQLDLESLVSAVLDPGIDAIGVMPLEEYYPAADRRALAMRFNHLLAAPSFALWMQGEPLDVDRLLYDRTGKPQHTVISLAHLSDAERMFFVTLLLDKTVQWTRQQSGTSALRALLYMDEIFGFLPPVAEPPSKKPLLTLLKQARAYGLGVMLTTQNPGDLDYRALGNIGTWFIGRLTAARDQEKLLAGLQGLAPETDSGRLRELLAGLQPQEFILNHVHSRELSLFESRWCMSYLRGPLTRAEHQKLYELGLLVKQVPAASQASVPAMGKSPSLPSPAVQGTSPVPEQPVSPQRRGNIAALTILAALPDNVPALFDNSTGTDLYPALLGQVRVLYEDKRSGVHSTERAVYRIPLEDALLPLRWDQISASDQDPEQYQRQVPAGVTLYPLPPAAKDKTSYTAWRKELIDWVYRNSGLKNWTHAGSGISSLPGEDKRTFLIRLQDELHRERDKAVVKVRQQYEKEAVQLARKIAAAEQALGREQSQSQEAKRQTAISFGGALLSMFMGRSASVGNVGRTASAVRGVSRSKHQADDVKRQEAKLSDLQAEAAAQDEKLQAELDRAANLSLVSEKDLTEGAARPLKKNISVELLAVIWQA